MASTEGYAAEQGAGREGGGNSVNMLLEIVFVEGYDGHAA